MQGSFSTEAVELYAQLVNANNSQNFSETENYDFTRCIRPNGTGFGTSGKCFPPNRPAPAAKNSEADKLEKEAENLMSGGRRNSRAMQEVARRLREKAQKLRQSS